MPTQGFVEHPQPDRGATAADRARTPAKRSVSTVMSLQRTIGNTAVARMLTGSAPAAPSVQRDASRDELLQALRSAVAQGAWQQVALRLNGFNEDDIKAQTAMLSLGQAANTRAATKIFLAGWPHQQLILDGLDQGGPEVRRIGDLYEKYERAVQSADWPTAADALAPMTREDVQARVGKLDVTQRQQLGIVAGGRQPLTDVLRDLAALPPGTTYADVRADLAYIDNFVSASYDVFRRELHLTFEDGGEPAIPMAELRGTPPRISPQLQRTIDQLQKSGDLTLPSSTSVNAPPGSQGVVTVYGPDVFYNDPRTGLLRPQNLRPSVAPRLYQAITELDTDTQDLLYQAAVGWVAGPPMPEGSEWLILLPFLARGGMGLRNALAKAAERKALTAAEQAELRALASSGTKRPYASSLGELEEAGVMAKTAPGATLAPPKMRAVDWYEGGKQVQVTVQEKYKGQAITVVETHVSGGTWSQLHTILEAKDATAANVTAAVTNKLDKYWDRLHNPGLNKPARDPTPIAPNTYRRVYLESPDRLVINIHVREAPATEALTSAANNAYTVYANKTDLPPVTIIVTGTGK
ncbi:hypothetical protein [Microlunatus sp. Gsoil 973]|uniref:hypothetical protein n=1 Tax=Microlunatus sp. Gsoil 973 TaxID=2672569 RepID=UPI0012B48074|nr:hypothetical protein [Microlunatus sp. Gsoil 973]QGN31562.1 hypothetical protein GJV80_00530 [Microlunatus sp. Gsoil 973]